MEGESGNLSEVTEGFSPGTPAIERFIYTKVVYDVLCLQLMEISDAAGGKNWVACDFTFIK